MKIEIKSVDYLDPQQGQELLLLLNTYACDPMGGGQPLAESVRDSLLECLSQVPGAFSLIAYVEGQPAAFTTGFEGYSTFKCKPLINIHDLAVLPEFRGLGLSQKSLNQVEQVAQQRGARLVPLGGRVAARRAWPRGRAAAGARRVARPVVR